MSGFAGVANFDGAPVHGAVLERMADALAFRGPDRRTVTLAGCAGFAHSLLAATDESRDERQPASDGQRWIVGDVRIDARADLLAQMPAAPPADAEPDIATLLRAYRAFGDRVVHHLLGDFAFVVWDSANRRLFAARDHLGVRPLYYARLGSTLIFGNTLACVRRHPLVSDRLDDVAIADFLLFDASYDNERTSFADVKRVPPAHALTASRTGQATSRYWTLPADEPLLYRSAGRYTEEFRSLLDRAIADRLRTPTVGVFMSGGLDSTTLVAAAAAVQRRRGVAPGVRALTWTEDGHDGGRERAYAGAAARHVGVPIDFFAADGAPTDWQWERAAASSAEPTSRAWKRRADAEYYAGVAAATRVVLHGEGPDNALYYEWQSYLRYLVRTRRALRLAADLGRFLATQRRLPLWDYPVRTMVQNGPPPASYPPWMSEELERRCGLRERWRAARAATATGDLVRPRSRRSFESPLWQRLFDSFDAERTRAALEVRYPFLDLRVLRFLLAVPAVPWCRGKYLLRRAMRDELPPAILSRRKHSLPEGEIVEIRKRLAASPCDPAPRLLEYVNDGAWLPRDGADRRAVEACLRVRALNQWLRGVTATAEREENRCEQRA